MSRIGLILFLVAMKTSYAQTITPSDKFSEAIEDNSFFIEEAYNQEPGVVQHITNGLYFNSPQRDVALSFTQEWPVGSQTHQLSYTIPYAFLNGNTVSGLGDILLNYRCQVSTGDNWLAFAPRISAVLPTGSSRNGLGMGVVGVQINLPLSKRLTEYLAAHVNVGATIAPGVKGTNGTGNNVKRTLTSFNAGGSVIVLASAHFNIMLEVVTNFLSDIDSNGGIKRTTETILSPGMRWAIDVDQLQIVPGVAVPVVVNEGDQHVGMFFYLSFEHPF